MPRLTAELIAATVLYVSRRPSRGEVPDIRELFAGLPSGIRAGHYIRCMHPSASFGLNKVLQRHMPFIDEALWSVTDRGDTACRVDDQSFDGLCDLLAKLLVDLVASRPLPRPVDSRDYAGGLLLALLVAGFTLRDIDNSLSVVISKPLTLARAERRKRRDTTSHVRVLGAQLSGGLASPKPCP